MRTIREVVNAIGEEQQSQAVLDAAVLELQSLMDAAVVAAYNRDAAARAAIQGMLAGNWDTNTPGIVEKAYQIADCAEVCRNRSGT